MFFPKGRIRGLSLTYMLSVSLMFAIVTATLATMQSPIAVARYVNNSKTGPASDRLIFIRVNLNNASEALGTSIDVYLYPLHPSAALSLLNRTDVKIVAVPSGIIDLILNPAPVYINNYSGIYTKEEIAEIEGVPPDAITYFEVNLTGNWTYAEFGAHPRYGINPFAFREVRYAINFLIDREKFVELSLHGFGIPATTMLSLTMPISYDLLDELAKLMYSYNPSIAAKIIDDKLTKVGAVKKDGKWYYNGKPINITFIIRVEDERKELGDMVADELEKIGFTVARVYLPFSDAIKRVYTTNPMDFKWHIYTEGWGRGAIDRWDPWMVTQFAAPWFGWMPGWGNPAWWNYKNNTIDELSRKLVFGDVQSKEEYIKLYKELLELAGQEAVRIWVADVFNFYPLMSYVRGETADEASGLRGLWNLRELYIPGNDTVRIGHLYVFTALSVWNPFGGFKDIYSIDIMRATYDPMVWRHPFNGEVIPFRITYEVLSPPNGVIVPADAVVWNATIDQWVSVSTNIKAKSVVIFNLSKLIGARWHHGINISWADILVELAQKWELAYDAEKAELEPPIAQSLRSVLNKVKAIKIDPEKKLLYVYVDYKHFDPNYIADYAAIIDAMVPLELREVMFYLAFTEKSYALSSQRAEKEGIPQLNLVLANHAADIARVAKKFLNDTSEYEHICRYAELNNTCYLPLSEWKKRLEALINWIDRYDHAWVSQGPYILTYFDPSGQRAELNAFRDSSYPFHPGDWYFGYPTPTRIKEVKCGPIYVGEHYRADVYVEGIEPINVAYALRDNDTGQVLYYGLARRVNVSHYVIEIPENVTAALKASKAYVLIVIAKSEQMNTFDKTSLIVYAEEKPTTYTTTTRGVIVGGKLVYPSATSESKGTHENIGSIVLAVGACIAAYLASLYARRGSTERM